MSVPYLLRPPQQPASQSLLVHGRRTGQPEHVTGQQQHEQHQMLLH